VSEPRPSNPDLLTHGHPHPEELVFDFGGYKDVAYFVLCGVWIVVGVIFAVTILRDKKKYDHVYTTIDSIAASVNPNHAGDTVKIPVRSDTTNGGKTLS
jgi:hypothetical protein